MTINLEYCVICSSETGRAGRSDDSIFVATRKTQDEFFNSGISVCDHVGDEVGPLCEDCYDQMNRLGFIDSE